MKTTVTKQFHFEAAHSLPHLPEGHKCRRVHGHSYRFDLHVTGPTDPTLGWVIDFADISAVARQHVVDVLDHRDLNEFLQPSTAEKLAEWIFARCAPHLPGLTAVDVYETRTSRVRVEA